MTVIPVKKDKAPLAFEDVALELAERHRAFEERVDVSMPEVGRLVSRMLALLFPHYIKDNDCGAGCLAGRTEDVRDELAGIIKRLPGMTGRAPEELATTFVRSLPAVLDDSMADIEAVLAFDPAASSRDEVILAYPGFFAITIFRMAYRLRGLGVPLLPRLMSEYGHQKTGIDINPGAQIGRSFFIDHGTAIVIGETAVIGDNVRIYQGVTIGALRVEKSDKGAQRHPTLEDGVVVYANATILGGETTVGRGSIIGGNVWLTESVPAWSRVSYKSCNETGMSRLAIEQRDPAQHDGKI